MYGRLQTNGWEVCWTEGSISEPYARNLAQAIAEKGFANGTYSAAWPSGGEKSVECAWATPMSTGVKNSVMGCRGGTVGPTGAVELSYLG